MFGFSTTETILIVFVIYLGGKDLVKILAIFPMFAPLVLILEKMTPKNGNGKNGKIAEKLDEIEGNSLEHIQQGIDDIKEISSESLYILKDIKEALKK